MRSSVLFLYNYTRSKYLIATVPYSSNQGLSLQPCISVKYLKVISQLVSNERAVISYTSGQEITLASRACQTDLGTMGIFIVASCCSLFKRLFDELSWHQHFFVLPSKSRMLLDFIKRMNGEPARVCLQ